MANDDTEIETGTDTVQAWVLAACQDLGLNVDADSDFFRAGGSSLTAVKLIARAEETFGEDSLPPEDLFGNSGIREIAESIVRNRQQVDAPQA
ncbi:acyl carrier protein [Lentzea sp. NPDC092896]|uniref:acyl carrier protein n=1 Tax=Lentzea sp. NPDC092896 TaxID=3364127 RepID=UPI0038104FE0